MAHRIKLALAVIVAATLALVAAAQDIKAPLERSPELGNRLLPGIGAATRISMTVAADGAPSIALADKQDRPRVRLALTSEGYGAIEFLDANGKVVETFAPEARKTKQ